MGSFIISSMVSAALSMLTSLTSLTSLDTPNTSQPHVAASYISTENSRGIQPRDESNRPAYVGDYKFIDLEGSEVSIKSFEGKYVFVEIWSLFCGPCLREMPHLKKLAEDYADKPIEFVAICIENNVPAWTNFVNKRGFSGNHWVTPLKSAFLSENRLAFVPTFILVDKKGHIQWRKAKAPSNPELRSDLNALFD